MNPLLLEVMIEERRRELLAEAERQRLIAIYNADNPGWWARLLLGLGELFIRLGEKIKRRYSRPLDIGEDNLCHEYVRTK